MTPLDAMKQAIDLMQLGQQALPSRVWDAVDVLRTAIAELEKAEDTYPVDSELVWYKNFEDLKESSQRVIDMLRKELGIVIEARDSDKRQANGYFVENSRLNTLCVNLETQLAAMTKERDANVAYFEAYHQLRVAVNAAYPQDPYQLAEDVPALIQSQLAATEALCQQYREALEKLAKLGNGDYYGTSIGNSIAYSALTLPSPTAALNNAIAAELERMCRVAKKATWQSELLARAKELREMK